MPNTHQILGHTINLELEALKEKFGFSLAQWIPLQKPLSMHIYQDWIANKFHADMDYLADHAEKKSDPQKFLPRAQSVICLAWPYFPNQNPHGKLAGTRIALYAQEKDYHQELSLKMNAMMDELRMQFPGEEFWSSVDSLPVLERDLAVQAGLGWVGKNTCLIHPKKGSLFFLSQIHSSRQLSEEKKWMPLPDLCGTCTRCLDICPTKALREPRVLDANLCISYWTIEAQKTPPENLRPLFGDWLFGCDLCQTVCPWNQKILRREVQTSEINKLHLQHSNENRLALIEDLRWILQSSNRELQKTLRSTPLTRARGFGLKKNALVVIANQKLLELLPEVEGLQKNPRLQELAMWTVQQLKGSKPNPHSALDENP